MVFEGDLAFGYEGAGYVAALLANGDTVAERLGLRQAEAEEDDQDRGPGAEPEKRPPAVRGGVDEPARKGRGEQVAKCVALLEHAGDETAGRWRTVFDGGCGGVSVQPAHCDAEECSHGEELLVGLAEACAELEDDEEDVVNYKGPGGG